MTGSKYPGQAAGTRKARVRATDVARALNLSKGTVSRALNGYPDISESTRLKVRNQAREMGYVPLSHAQAIRTGRVRSLGLVLRVDSHDSHRAFLTNFLDGVSRAVSAEDWTLTVATADSDANEHTTLSRLVFECKADGFILPRTKINDPRVGWLQDEQVPFILYGRPTGSSEQPWFDISGDAAMSEAVTHLAKLGHRRIAFVNGDRRYTYAETRRAGFDAGARQYDLEVLPGYILGDVVTPEQGGRATRALLGLDEPPTAIIFALDGAALGAYGVARELGLTIGRDVSITGYDGTPEGLYASPPLSTFVVDSRRAGARLASLLIARIRSGAGKSISETTDARFVARGSDGPPCMTSHELARAIRAYKPEEGRKT